MEVGLIFENSDNIEKLSLKYLLNEDIASQ